MKHSLVEKIQHRIRYFEQELMADKQAIEKYTFELNRLQVQKISRSSAIIEQKHLLKMYNEFQQEGQDANNQKRKT